MLQTRNIFSVHSVIVWSFPVSCKDSSIQEIFTILKAPSMFRKVAKTYSLLCSDVFNYLPFRYMLSALQKLLGDWRPVTYKSFSLYIVFNKNDKGWILHAYESVFSLLDFYVRPVWLCPVPHFTSLHFRGHGPIGFAFDDTEATMPMSFSSASQKYKRSSPD